jgi:hypothetical protein
MEAVERGEFVEGGAKRVRFLGVVGTVRRGIGGRVWDEVPVAEEEMMRAGWD